MPTPHLRRNLCAECKAPAYRRELREVLCDPCQSDALHRQQTRALEEALRTYTDADTCTCSDKGHHDCAWCVGVGLLGETDN